MKEVSLSVSFCFSVPSLERRRVVSWRRRREGGGAQKACSIILILGCVWVTFGGMIVSHLGVWGVIFPPIWSHSPDLCKLAVKHIAARPSYPHMTCQYTQAEKALPYIQTFTQHIYILHTRVFRCVNPSVCHASQQQLMPNDYIVCI